ncbi:MAG: hypothetical protein RL885_18255 [Planctomycetota bacterium]
MTKTSLLMGLVSMFLLVSGCVDAGKKQVAAPVKEAGDLMEDAQDGLDIVAHDVAIVAIFMPSASSSEEPGAFVKFRDGREPRMIHLDDEIRLAGGKTAILRGLQTRTAIFEVDGRREVLTMPPLVPKRPENGDSSQ